MKDRRRYYNVYYSIFLSGEWQETAVLMLKSQNQWNAVKEACRTLKTNLEDVFIVKVERTPHENKKSS